MRGALRRAAPAAAALLLAACAAPPPGDSVLLVTTDGLRWQDLFNGADEKLLNKADGGVRDPEALRKEFWRETPRERREALMPFFWGTIAREGQVFGNPEKGSVARLTNGLKFSYPGYHEILAGFPDPRIDSNKKIPNPNVTVLEWLNRRPGFEGRAAAYCSWDVFPFILNRERSGLHVNAGEPEPGQDLLNALRAETPDIIHSSVLDALTFHPAMVYLQASRPRVLYIALGETDEWAHAGRYDLYLQAARRVDRYLERLWRTAQAMPEYRGRTSLVVTTDHGRGTAPSGWKSHGKDVAGAENIWIAVLGPRTRPLGERENVAEVTQAQVAATVAALVGEDWCAAEPRAASPLPVVAPGKAGAR